MRMSDFTDESSDDIVRRLGQRFPQVANNLLREVVAQCQGDFEGCRIRDYVPILVERTAITRLRLMLPIQTNRGAVAPVMKDPADETILVNARQSPASWLRQAFGDGMAWMVL
jgi:hypothetical protein